jgi:hypothetical protein
VSGIGEPRFERARVSDLRTPIDLHMVKGVEFLPTRG